VLAQDFAAKNSISLKEMREARYWLRVILHCDLAASESVQPLLAEANELTAMLTAGMRRLHPMVTLIITVGLIAFAHAVAVS
jgi:four helix bundle protein